MEHTDNTCSVKKAQEQKEQPRLWPMTTMWTTKDVADFVADVGYEKYSKCFRRNAISGGDLPNLTVFDVRRLGVGHLEDAICIHSALKTMTRKMLPNLKHPDQPPNISNAATRKKYCRVPDTSNPNYCACQVPRLPPLPAYEMNVKPSDMAVPYRDRGDRYNRYNLGCQSYHDHCMVTGRKDVWMMYNSKF